jgi:hypothetical protein
MPADSVRLVCQVQSDTTELAEGEPIRVIRIGVEGGSVRIWIERGAIHSIMVESPAFRTADSIGVGSPLARLLEYRDLTGGYGEGDYYVMSDSASACGLSFLMDFRVSGKRPPVDGSRKALAPFASTAKVSGILIRGC